MGTKREEDITAERPSSSFRLRREKRKEQERDTPSKLSHNGTGEKETRSRGSEVLKRMDSEKGRTNKTETRTSRDGYRFDGKKTGQQRPRKDPLASSRDSVQRPKLGGSKFGAQEYSKLIAIWEGGGNRAKGGVLSFSWNQH